MARKNLFRFVQFTASDPDLLQYPLKQCIVDITGPVRIGNGKTLIPLYHNHMTTAGFRPRKSETLQPAD